MSGFKMIIRSVSSRIALSALLCAAISFGATGHGASKGPILIKDQGAEAFGGTVIGDPSTGTLHCDHGYVHWLVPETKDKKMPLLMWHSASTKTWESPTPSGGDGFDNLMLRRGYPVYIIDIPPSGRAGQSCEPFSYTPNARQDQGFFNGFRLGLWIPPDPPQFYPNVQFTKNDPAALDQVLRASYLELQTQENSQLQSDVVAELLNKIGPTVLLTHSGSGVRGWWTRIKSENVKGIVAYEPGHFVFPEGEVPPPILRADGAYVEAPNPPLGSAVPLEDFMKLTQIPIQILIGDNIPAELDPANVGPRLGLDNARIRIIQARLFAEAINNHGGDASVYVLPEHGIFGNTHFIMWDKNNEVIANLLTKFLKQKGIDQVRVKKKSRRDRHDHHHRH